MATRLPSATGSAQQSLGGPERALQFDPRLILSPRAWPPGGGGAWTAASPPGPPPTLTPIAPTELFVRRSLMEARTPVPDSRGSIGPNRRCSQTAPSSSGNRLSPGRPSLDASPAPASSRDPLGRRPPGAARIAPLAGRLDPRTVLATRSRRLEADADPRCGPGAAKIPLSPTDPGRRIPKGGGRRRFR
jgi:hypothetical protein